MGYFSLLSMIFLFLDSQSIHIFQIGDSPPLRPEDSIEKMPKIIILMLWVTFSYSPWFSHF